MNMKKKLRFEKDNGKCIKISWALREEYWMTKKTTQLEGWEFDEIFWDANRRCEYCNACEWGKLRYKRECEKKNFRDDQDFQKTWDTCAGKIPITKICPFFSDIRKNDGDVTEISKCNAISLTNTRVMLRFMKWCCGYSILHSIFKNVCGIIREYRSFSSA